MTDVNLSLLFFHLKDTSKLRHCTLVLQNFLSKIAAEQLIERLSLLLLRLDQLLVLGLEVRCELF